ncbi:MAG: hypothetical protein ACRENP_18340 [Longimicrobiales bacterium]
MFRLIATRCDAERPAPQRVGRWMALGLPVLAPILFIISQVSSVTVSPTDVTGGSNSTGTVTLNAPSSAGVLVDLLSSRPALATVPKSITISNRNGTGTFGINTGSGQMGCATISAKVGTTSARSAVVFVKPPDVISPIALTLSKTSTLGGESSSGTVLAPAAAVGSVVQLRSSNPSVTVPASVTLGHPGAGDDSGLSRASFTINSTAVPQPTCAIITAIHGGSQNHKLLKVFPFIAG